ncbi:MAG: stage II sporulation protein P [Oscillospiraceae bacterium]|nr:stage II sporulation protein P [Oscillospiraceae bacterium]
MKKHIARYRRIRPRADKNARRRLPRVLASTVACALLLAVTLKISGSLAGAQAGVLLGGTLSGSGVSKLIDFELAGASGYDLAALILGTHADDTDDVPSDATPTPSIAPAASPSPSPTPDESNLFYNANGQPPNRPPQQDDGTKSADGITIINSPGVVYDANALLNQPLNLKLPENKPNILIIHTHTSEAYTPTAQFPYTESDPYRTEDPTRNIVAVGEVIAKALSAQGFNVIHDRGVYDYPSYTGCYGRTLTVVADYMEKYPTIECVLDVHRDAVEDADGKQYKTIAQIDGQTCSQISFFVGTDVQLTNPAWRNNLAFALKLEYEMNRAYPTLTRPIFMSQYRYNQHLNPQYVIVEVGSTGNTLEESLIAAGYFADSLATVMAVNN